MTNSEKFCLKWNDFESNLSSAFNDLREEKEFLDVTLVCDDNQIEAHQVVISACSSFFRNILKKTKHSHPMVYLRGVPYSQLVSVLTFMYKGEVSVAQEQLNSFLHTAEDLKVKGLTQGGAAVQKPQRREVAAPLSNEPGDADVEEIQEIPVKVEAANTVAVDEDPLDAGYDYLDQDQSGLQYDNFSSYDTHNMELDKGNSHL